MLICSSIRTFESRAGPFGPVSKISPVSLLILHFVFRKIHFYKQFSAACTVSDASFTSHKVKPLMPNTPIWKEVRQGRNDVGVLLEIQTVACADEMQNLGKVWWPLTQAHISKSLQVREDQITVESAIESYLGCSWC